MRLNGRRKIELPFTTVTQDNVIDILRLALPIHAENQVEIRYLHNYYKGAQPILLRKKGYRPQICNNIVENRANEIVSFKTGYMCGEPIIYASSNENERVIEQIATLNEYMKSQCKRKLDRKLFDWMHICGTSYRFVGVPESINEDDAPFYLQVLNPENTFVVYSSEIQDKPIMGVTLSNDFWYRPRMTDGLKIKVYTADSIYEIEKNKVVSHEPHYLSGVPIVEYPANDALLGAFEIVIPLLDALNLIQSNRVDAVEQFVQAIMVLKGTKLKDMDIENLASLGGISIPNDADLKYLVEELNQTQIQTLVDHLYDSVLTICGMPNRNGGSSTSDTGQAVMMRDGWSAAEARAKDSESMFEASEIEMLKLILDICRTQKHLDLGIRDIAVKFTRRNYDNLLNRVQALDMMLKNPWIHPQDAFATCPISSNPMANYLNGKIYHEQYVQSMNATLEEDVQRERVQEVSNEV